VSAPLLEVEALSRHYGGRAAVDGVSFSLRPGEVFGIVGESGSGKSTLARMVMALDRPSGGRVMFEGKDLFALGPAALRQARRGFQMVFQDPNGSLDPRMRVGRIIAEPLHLRPSLNGQARRELVAQALASVGLAPEHALRYPHEFSGGQRQRIAIARALVTGPALIVADEPVSALDLSVQAQILNLLMDLRDQQGLAILLISHNLAVVAQIADTVAVMREGRFVETGPAAQVLTRPSHPYAQALLDAVPRLDAPRRPIRPSIAIEVGAQAAADLGAASARS